MTAADALRAVATFRLVMPRTILRFTGDEILGDQLGVVLAAINAMVGNT